MSRNATRLYVLVGLFLTAIPWQPTHADEQVPDSRRPRVAVMDLRPKKGFSEPEAESLSGLLRSALFQTHAFDLVNREDMESIAENNEIELRVCDEEKCLLQLGTLLGAEKLVVGDVGEVFGEYTINVRLVDIAARTLVNENVTSRLFTKDDLQSILAELASELARGPSPILSSQETRLGDVTEPWQPREGGDVVVRFESEPSGAMIEIGDQLLCETPCSQALQPGSYSVAMKMTRHLTRREVVQIRRGMSPLHWSLEPNFGWLTVTSDPPGIPVGINGEHFGQTPLHKRELQPGVYDVLIQDPHYHEAGERVIIERGETEEVELIPTPRQGAIKIEARDLGGNAIDTEVYVDGTKMGRTWEPITLIIGQHEAETRTGGRNWTGTVTVSEQEVTSITITLESTDDIFAPPSRDRNQQINEVNSSSPLLSPTSDHMQRQAPETYTVLFKTTKGDIHIEVHRAWAPRSADRFYNLVHSRYYDGCRFFRIISDFVAQIGIHGDPDVNRAWCEAVIRDDPARQSNKRGMVAFARSARPNSATTQIFINLKNNTHLDGTNYVPFGKVTSGMDVVSSLYSGYGEAAPRGKGPEQVRIVLEGNAYLEKSFPKLDYVTSCSILGDN